MNYIKVIFRILSSAFLVVTFINICLAQSPQTLSGIINGSNGKPISEATVHLTKLGASYRKPILTTKISGAGKFNLTVTENGLYQLWVMAPQHELLNFPIEITSMGNQAQNFLVIRLAPISFNKIFENIKIVGDWNNFDVAKAEPMKKSKNGTFVYERKGINKPVGYMLLNVVENRPISGTMADSYHIDGDDYISVINVKNSTIKIVFDPAKLPSSANPASVTFDKDHQYLTELFEMDAFYQKSRKEFDRAFWKYVKATNNTAELKFEIPALQRYLLAKMRESNNPLLKQYAATLLLKLGELGIKIPRDDFNEAISIIPPDSKLWSLNSQLISAIASGIQPDILKPVLQTIVKTNPDRVIQARAFLGLTQMELIFGNRDEYIALYKDLKANYKDINDIKLDVFLLNPENKISVGKQVPDFKLNSIGSNQTVSNKDLLGKYYLIDFWATWCDPCLAELPKLHKTYEKYKDKGLGILSISVDTDPSIVPQFRGKTWNMPWMHATLKDWQESQVGKDFNLDVLGLPRIILISPEGKILATQAQLRRDALDETLQKVLNKP